MTNFKHGLDRANDIFALSIKDQKQLFKTLEAEDVAHFLPYIDTSKRVAVFMRFSAKQHIAILNEMASDDSLELLRLLPKKYADKLIEQSDDEEEFKLLLSYDENAIGAYVTFDYIQLFDDMLAKEATKKVILEAPDVEVLSELLVTDSKDVLIGVIKLKTLLRLEAQEPIKVHLETITMIDGKKSITEAISLMESSKQKILPVMDNDVLLGMITLDDALDLYEESAIEDVKKFSALPDIETHFIRKDALKRLPWLFSLLIFFIPILLLTQSFEVVIAQFVILMLFQPLILGSAGNVATQTLGITLQSLSKQEISISKTFIKEMLASVLIALTMSMFAFILTWVYGTLISTEKPLIFAMTISFSLGLTLITAPFIAIVIPTILKFLKQDPAIASGPFITTLIDIAALLIYFSMATLLLGGVTP